MGPLLQAAALHGDLHVLLARHLAQICKVCMQQVLNRLRSCPTKLP